MPTIGASVVLNHPLVAGALRGYPYDPEALDRIVRSPLRHGFSVLPGALRRSVLRSLPTEMSAAGAFAGPPSVAHAEALLRALELRRAELDAPLDALVIGIPGTTPYLPRERPNPLLAAYLGLGLALRLWRDAFPLVDGGTAILVNRFARHFAHPTQQPYRVVLPRDTDGTGPRAARRRRAARPPPTRVRCATTAPAAASTRCSRSGTGTRASRRSAASAPCSSPAPATRPPSASSASSPSHGIGAALDMARGRAGSDAPRIGFLLSPPYFPLRVGGG